MTIGPADPAIGNLDAHAPAKRGLSLRWRLILLVVAAVVPLLIFNLSYQYSEYRDDVAVTGTRTEALARDMAALVEDELRIRIAALETLAPPGALRRDDLETFRRRADAVVAQQFPGSNILLLQRDGQQLLNTILPPGTPLPVRPNLESLEQVFTIGRPAVSNLYQGAVGRRPVVAIDVPVKGTDGNVEYVLSMNPRLDLFADIIQRQHLPATWLFAVFDRHGITIARYPDGASLVGLPASSPVLPLLLGQHDGHTQFDSREGIPSIVGFSHGEQFGWAVSIGVPREELSGPVVSRGRNTLGVCAALLALALGLALYAARGIARPIESLRRFAASDRAALPTPAPSGLPEADEVAQALYTTEIERRRSREAELLLRDGIEGIPEGFSIYDADDRLVMCNESYRSLFADSEERVVAGARFEDIVRAGVEAGHFPAAVGREEEWIAARVREHREAEAPIEQRLSDGRWVLVTKHRLSNGWVAGLRVDITALKTVEEALRGSERAERGLREGIETMPQGFVLYDDQGRLVICNESYRSFYPETADQMVPGIRFEDILRIGIASDRFPEAKGREEEWIAERVRRQSDEMGTIEQQVADGRWVLVTKHRLANGWIAGLRVEITTLKTAEEALRGSEQRFRRVVEAVPNAIIMVGADGNVELVNAQAETIFGHPRADLLGQSIEMLLPDRYRAGHPGLRNGFFGAPQARLMGVGRELYALRRGGQEFPVEVGLSPIETEDGLKVLASVVDITARREAERMRGYYASIVESTADAIIAKDLNGVVTSWNQAAGAIFGYSASEMVGEPISRLLPTGRPDEETAILAQILRGERIDRFETVRRRKDGAEFPVSLTISPIFGPGGEIIGASKIARDITERQHMEASLRASEEQLNRAQRLAQMGSDTRDLRTDAAVWSDETYRIFGIDKGTPVPSTEAFLRIVHPDDRAAILKVRDQLKQGINPAPFEYRIVRADGSVRHIYRESEVINDDDGSPLYMIGTLHDVTERRRIEDQLRQAQKMEAIGNLTGGMAHDFNNLLGVIVGNLDLARESLGDHEDLQELVGEALEAAWRGADLTRRLLAFARRQPLRPARIEINELVSDTVRLLRRLLGEDIEVALDLGADLWPVTADPAQLEATLANLANNARDAMPTGGRLIIATANRRLGADFVSTHGDVAPGEYVMIEVSDTGIGMSPETMSRIFEPFFTTKEAGKGTGLGLSMVFGFLRQSGGQVNVYSEIGQGTTFRLYLPRATTEAEAEARETEEVLPAPHGAGETILVVEDNPAMRRVVLRQMRELGYRTLDCEHAAAALDVLNREPVDLLFTDIVMPGGLDGVELARIARERWPALKILLTSGFPQARVEGNGGFPGGMTLLSKPYRKEELAAALRVALGG